MDSTIDNYGLTDLSLEEEELLFISGAPRTRKTTSAMEEVLSPLSSIAGPDFVFMSRTKENAYSAYETFRKYVDEDNAYRAVLYMGTTEMCPVDTEDSSLPGYLAHSKHCGAAKYVHKGNKGIILEIIKENGTDFTKETWKALHDAGYCPRAVVEWYIGFLKEKDGFNPLVLFTTYFSAENLIEEHKNLVSERAVICDEVRHTTQLFTEQEQVDLGSSKEKNFEGLFEEYISQIREMDLDYYYEVFSGLEEILDDLFEHLRKCLKGWQKAREMDDYSKKDISNKAFKDISKKFQEGQRLDKENLSVSPENYLWLQLEREYGETRLFPPEHYLHNETSELGVSEGLIERVEDNLEDTEDENLLEIWKLLKIGESLQDEGNRADFDFVKDQSGNFSLDLVVRERKNGFESREKIKQIIETSKQTVAIDSTPHPEEFEDFVLGSEEFDLVRSKKGTDYEFQLVVEDAKNSRSDTYPNQENRQRMYNKICGIQEMYEREGKKTVVFARAKAEKRKLEANGVENVKYARGSDSEGTSLEGDVVLSMGPPIQNIHSDGYRKYDFARMAGYSDYEKAMNDLRWVKALQEMMQHSFRTVSENEGKAVLLNASFDAVKEAARYWNWMNDEEIQIERMKTKNYSISDKIGEIKALTIEGKEEYITETKTWIRRDIRVYLEQKGPTQTETLIKSIKGDTNTIREVKDQMINEGIIKVEKGQYNRKILEIKQE